MQFAIIRAGYRGSVTGSLVEDPMFVTNMKGAQAAGIPVGVYFSPRLWMRRKLWKRLPR